MKMPKLIGSGSSLYCEEEKSSNREIIRPLVTLLRKEEIHPERSERLVILDTSKEKKAPLFANLPLFKSSLGQSSHSRTTWGYREEAPEWCSVQEE